MKLPNWFKILWWLVLLGLSGFLAFKRYEALATGQATPADIFLLAFFVMFLLLPLFAEFEFLGVKLKKEIDDLKNEIRIKFGDIKSEIRSTQSQTIHNTVHPYGPPPTDSEIAKLQKQLEEALAEQKKKGKKEKESYAQYVPHSVEELFRIRYQIETELRRIRGRYSDEPRFERHRSLIGVLTDLRNLEIIDADFQGILREMLAVCNAAVHGEDISESQRNFVVENADEVLAYLRGII